MFVDMRPTGRWITALNEQTIRIFCGPRVETCRALTQDITERIMAGEIANRIRLNLRCADVVEETHRELIGDDGTSAGVMRGQNFMRAVGVDQIVQV